MERAAPGDRHGSARGRVLEVLQELTSPGCRDRQVLRGDALLARPSDVGREPLRLLERGGPVPVAQELGDQLEALPRHVLQGADQQIPSQGAPPVVVAGHREGLEERLDRLVQLPGAPPPEAQASVAAPESPPRPAPPLPGPPPPRLPATNDTLRLHPP